MNIDIAAINKHLEKEHIVVTGAHSHNKASEVYVDVIYSAPDGSPIWDGSIPVHYRRTGLALKDETEIANHLLQAREHLLHKNRHEWIKTELAHWKQNHNAEVTFAFFEVLATLKWVHSDDFPKNNNPQRRIQDIKDKGYTIATRRDGKSYKRILVPLPKSAGLGYETFSTNFKRKALSVLGGQDIYEMSGAGGGALIPDHKFPEMRWDHATIAKNPDDMSEAEIRRKFQLLNNQRNQQKREACRKCFQSGKRPTLFGIDYYYQGTEDWPHDAPKTGAAAEAGCIGCGWYDVAQWRAGLSQKLKAKS